mgnify:CR=1 FL=1
MRPVNAWCGVLLCFQKEGCKLEFVAAIFYTCHQSSAFAESKFFDDFHRYLCRNFRGLCAVFLKAVDSAVCSGVGDATDGEKRNAIHIADMSNSSRFHFDRQWREFSGNLLPSFVSNKGFACDHTPEENVGKLRFFHGKICFLQKVRLAFEKHTVHPRMKVCENAFTLFR